VAARGPVDHEVRDQIVAAVRNPKFPGGQRFAAPLEALGKAYYRLRDLF
ncbi:hypothetical protein ACLBTQ_00005, partial [Pseudomonas aeruginosa]